MKHVEIILWGISTWAKIFPICSKLLLGKKCARAGRNNLLKFTVRLMANTAILNDPFFHAFFVC